MTMKPGTWRISYIPDSMAVSRPVRAPSDAEARRALARDLSRLSGGGYATAKIARILWLPLMDVALDGHEGFGIAQARDWSQAA